MKLKKGAVILLSGGLDSATTLAIARKEGYGIYALTVNYGQRHENEIEAAQAIAKSLHVVEHRVLALDLTMLRGSALTNSAVLVPKEGLTTGIPVTYVPARNTIFLSLACAWAETLNVWDIFIGANVVDYSGYPDCRPEYLEAYEEMINLGTKESVEGKGQFKIHAPLISLTKTEIIQKGLVLGVDYGMAHSCYDPPRPNVACGQCDSCRIRLNAFKVLGMTDPYLYE